MILHVMTPKNPGMSETRYLNYTIVCLSRNKYNLTHYIVMAGNERTDTDTGYVCLHACLSTKLFVDVYGSKP